MFEFRHARTIRIAPGDFKTARDRFRYRNKEEALSEVISACLLEKPFILKKCSSTGSAFPSFRTLGPFE